MYADDGLIFPKDGSVPPSVGDPERGIEKNEEKSG